VKKVILNIIFFIFSFQLSAQNDSEILELSVIRSKGYVFKLSLLKNQSTDSTEAKLISVYDSLDNLVFQKQFFGFLNKIPRTIVQMQVHDFDFDGFPDFRLISTNYESYPADYYLFDPEVNSFQWSCLLSKLTNIYFFTEKKEAIGHFYGNFDLVSSKNIKENNVLHYSNEEHRIFITGVKLEHFRVESKTRFMPWTYPFQENRSFEQLRIINNFKNNHCMFEKQGEQIVEQGEFSAFTQDFDVISNNNEIQKLKPLNLSAEKVRQKITRSNYPYPIRDTTLNGIYYPWVIYDLNGTPIEIGQDFTNEIRNGNWIFRDQNGRIVSIVNYDNDILNGTAEYFYYDNDPRVTKLTGMMSSNYMTGIWVLELKENRKSIFSKWKKIRYYVYHYSRKTNRIELRKNKPTFEAVYDENEKEVYWLFYDKKGKVTRETNVEPYLIENL
jgi:antitoxin component YwqK of YwqJK toxin-antitoxin module